MKRERNGKKPGGQIGHEGTTLPMGKHPQQVQVHQVKKYRGCGSSLLRIQP
jgi:hypothetical protein